MPYLNRILLLLLVGWVCFPAFAQTEQLNGQVVDSLNRAIPYANVLAINQSTQKIGAFAITNPEGKFKLSLLRGQQFLIRVSFVGFKLHEQEIADWSADAGLKIVLRQDETSLDLVEVVSEMPVTMRGDTLTYKTDAFTTGTERKLGDVLEKLPGFQVDDNGEVKVQGKKVDKVLVDGKVFFDGDTKLATKNLPANAVDRVQVLKNFNEISPIRGLDNDETLALNIQLKDGKKNMVFGDLTGGAGPQKRYLGHANTFYYAPKLNLNLIADANNIGELPFTLQDYFRFSGGMGGLGSKSGFSMSQNSEELGIPMAQRNNAQDLETNLVAFNFNFNPNPRWKHAGFAIGSISKNQFGSISQRTYLANFPNNQEALNSESLVRNSSGLLKYAATYTPKEETYIKYSAFGKFADIENRNTLVSDFGGLIQNIGSFQTRRPFAIQQKGEWFRASSDKNILSLEVNWEKKYQDPLYELTSNQKPLNGIVVLPDLVSYQLLQNQEIHAQTFEGVFNFYHILNPTNHFNWSLGARNIRQLLLGQLALKQASVVDDLSAFSNDNLFGLRDWFLGLTYKSKWKTLTWSPSVYLHQFGWFDQQVGQRIDQQKMLLMPSFYAKWAIKTNKSLTYNFRTEASFMDIQKLAQGWAIQDYNSVFAGNREIQNGYFWTHSLNYTYFDFFTGFNLFGNLIWQRKENDLGSSTDFRGISRLQSTLNILPINETLNGDLMLDKSFSRFKIQGSGRWNAFSTQTILNQMPNLNRQFAQNYNLKLTTTFFKKLEVDLGYTFEKNRYSATNAQNTFSTHSPKIELDWDIWKGLKMNADYTYNAYFNQAAGNKSVFDFFNIILSYQGKSSPWEFGLSIYNILDIRSIRRDSFSENLISTYSYFVQPRYGLLSIKWDI